MNENNKNTKKVGFESESWCFRERLSFGKRKKKRLSKYILCVEIKKLQSHNDLNV